VTVYSGPCFGGPYAGSHMTGHALEVPSYSVFDAGGTVAIVSGVYRFDAQAECWWWLSPRQTPGRVRRGR